MANFDNNNFDINSARIGNPWEASALPDRPDADSPVPSARAFTSIPLVRIIAFILLVALALYLLYAIFVHPINKLNLRLLLAKNCTVTLKVALRHEFGYAYGNVIMYIDGNLIALAQSKRSEPQSYTYIEMDGDKITVHEKTMGDWYVYDYDTYLQINGGSSSSYAMLFDRRNYERVKGRLFVWKIKDSVDTGNITDVQFRRKAGKFTFTWKENESKYTIIFESFGKAHLEPIWEEEDN